MKYFQAYTSRWEGFELIVTITSRAINIVVYYRPSEKILCSQFLELCKSRSRTRCIPYVTEGDTIPINKFKNMGIEKVVTTHFIFAENNLSPTSIEFIINFIHSQSIW